MLTACLILALAFVMANLALDLIHEFADPIHYPR